eukprot:RCo036450
MGCSASVATLPHRDPPRSEKKLVDGCNKASCIVVQKFEENNEQEAVLLRRLADFASSEIRIPDLSQPSLTNLALNKPTKCSAVLVAHMHRDDSSRFLLHGPDRAVDSNDTSAWHGGFDGDQKCWIAVDLSGSGDGANSPSLSQGFQVVETEVLCRSSGKFNLAIQENVSGTWLTLRTFETVTDQWVRASFYSESQQYRLFDTSLAKGRDHGMVIAGWRLWGIRSAKAPLVGSPDKPRVFISYQWGVQDTVRRLKRDIEAYLSVPAWMDIEQLTAGEEFVAEMYRGIKAADIVILCRTELYVKSVNCGREVNMATLLKKWVLVVDLSETFAVQEVSSVDADRSWAEKVLFGMPSLPLSTNPVSYASDAARILKVIASFLCDVLDGSAVDARTSAPNSAGMASKLTAPSAAPAELAVDFAQLECSVVPQKLSIRRVHPLSLESSCHRKDFALHRPCQASGNFVSDNDLWETIRPSALTDGKPNTRWSGAKDGEGKCWIVVDVGCDVTVDQVRVNFEAAYALVWALQVKRGDCWEYAEDRLCGGEGWHEYTLDPPVTARQFRALLVSPRWVGAGMSIWQLELWGTAMQQPVSDMVFTMALSDCVKTARLFDEVESAMLLKGYISDGTQETQRDLDFAIRNCGVLMCVVSQDSLSCPHVHEDLRRARLLGLPIVPIYFDSQVKWPPEVPEVRSLFDGLLYVDFRRIEDYSGSIGLLQRAIA